MFLTDGDGRVLTDEQGNPLWDDDPPLNITSLDPFLDELRWHLPEIPVSLVKPRLIRVIRDFCAKSWVVYRGFRVLSDHLDPANNMAVLVHIDEYMPSLVPVAVGEIKIDGFAKEATHRVLINASDDGLFYNLTDTTIRLFPFNTLPDIGLMVAFAPDGEATEYPGELVPYINDIVSGLLAELYSLPNKPWSDLGLSAYHWSQYHNAIGQAHGEWFLHHGTTGKTRWI